MTRVFVSGYYDIIHAGHLQFFEEARALGDHLTVSFAAEEILWEQKERRPSIPDDHKKVLLEGLRMVDEVVIGTSPEEGLEFREHFLRIRPDLLVVTEDDKYGGVKQELCDQIGARYVVLPKSPPRFKSVSSSSIVRWIQAPTEAPLRVDLAGGWLDVPRFSRPDGYIVNCAISPLVTLKHWPYEKQAGLGGSGAWALLNGHDGIDAELDLGVGWQDPAVIRETGLCVWRSGQRPVLDFKHNGDSLRGKLAILWTGSDHDTPGAADLRRDYDMIAESGRVAREGVLQSDLGRLAEGINLYHQAQLTEGMDALPSIEGAIARKYCGGGHGGYALYLFSDESSRSQALGEMPLLRAVEPFYRL
ncbi:adenylyltransferase/cytidyltransferase family protein [Haloferula chungangensis]|uniref:Adenylyltransferase/cytidyltransferase family protein n=1 Tax=Haloferula chungangensis TaxID=1048331 RepID=A0ABW2L6U1_9BACT